MVRIVVGAVVFAAVAFLCFLLAELLPGDDGVERSRDARAALLVGAASPAVPGPAAGPMLRPAGAGREMAPPDTTEPIVVDRPSASAPALTDAAAPVPGITVRVRVAEARTGSPIAEADVCLRQPRTGLARTGRTDARGRATLAAWPPGAWARARLAVSRADWLQLRDPAGGTFTRVAPDEVRVRLVRAARLSGRLLDGGGDPVEGALVHLDLGRSQLSHLAPLPSHGEESGVLIRGGAADRTDAEGRFALQGLPPGGPCVVGVRVEGRAPARRIFLFDRGEHRRGVVIRLARGAEIHGVVRAPCGEPAPAARVVVARNGRLIATVPADSHGAFRVSGALADRVTLKARAEGWADSRPIGVTVHRAGSVGPIRLALRRFAPAIRGRVVSPGGAGRPGVEVAAHPMRSPGLFVEETIQPPRAETDCEGCFRIGGLLPGWTYRLEAAVPGQRIATVCGPVASPTAPLTLVVPDTGELEVGLGPAVRGAVSRVSVAPSSMPSAGCSAAVRAWPVRFSGLPAGEYHVEGWHEGARVAAAPVVRVTAGASPARARLRPVAGRAISGTVTGATGRPLAGMPVSVVMRTADETAARRTTVTDAEGRFRLQGLGADVVDLVVGGDGRGRVVRTGVPVGARNLTIVFAPSCAVRVTVRAADGGAPLARADVGLVTAGLGAMRNRTDHEGRTVFRVSPGVYALVVRAEGYRPTGCRIPVGPAGREMAREFRLVRLDLRSRAGGPAPGVRHHPGEGTPGRDGR